jgi:CRISPR system Cascade subunit CasC
MTIPDVVYVAVRADRPISLAPAFEDPVRSQLGYTQPSVEALNRYADRLHEYWGTENITWHGHAAISGKPSPGLGNHVPSLTALIDGAVAATFPAREPR